MELAIFNQAAARIEQRASIASQILADLGVKSIPVESFNDDDWYEYDSHLQFIRTWSGKNWTQFNLPPVRNGNSVAKGMTAKWLGLWRYAA